MQLGQQTFEAASILITLSSSGGAISAVAGIALADLNPYVITFGQPPTIDAPCDLVTSERWFRYVNTKSVKGSVVGIAYDPVPFLPSMGTENFGHMIMLSDDSSSVAYIGLDVQEKFNPLNVHGFEAHSMIHAVLSEFPGYLDRIEALIATYKNRTYPVATTGYVAGSLCVSGFQPIKIRSNTALILPTTNCPSFSIIMSRRLKIRNARRHTVVRKQVFHGRHVSERTANAIPNATQIDVIREFVFQNLAPAWFAMKILTVFPIIVPHFFDALGKEA